MVFSPKTIWINGPLCLLLLSILACAPSPHFYLRYGDHLTQSDLDKILIENPLPATQNIKVATLGRGKDISHHVVQVRDRESPHFHKEHDLTVVVLRGGGYLMFDKERVDLAPGDVLFIPRGVVHYFVNTFPQPSVALAAFTPPFDGKDTIAVKNPSDNTGRQ
ncbi:MAG: cupin domain-containing protein [Candidatus Binatia bacterium]